MYKVDLSRPARRDLDHIEGGDLARLERQILALGANPRPIGVKKLEGRFHRIRAGDWRVLFAIDDATETVTILRVSRRSERTYKRL